jgi:hypothetical protein
MVSFFFAVTTNEQRRTLMPYGDYLPPMPINCPTHSSLSRKHKFVLPQHLALGRTRRSTGAADPVGIKWKADWRPPGQLGRR